MKVFGFNGLILVQERTGAEKILAPVAWSAQTQGRPHREFQPSRKNAKNFKRRGLPFHHLKRRPGEWRFRSRPRTGSLAERMI
jgi:capsid protein